MLNRSQLCQNLLKNADPEKENQRTQDHPYKNLSAQYLMITYYQLLGKCIINLIKIASLICYICYWYVVAWEIEVTQLQVTCKWPYVPSNENRLNFETMKVVLNYFAR